MTQANSNNDEHTTADAPAAEKSAAVDTAAEGTNNLTEEIAPVDAAVELEKLRAERDDFYNRYLRSVADLDNYRRRVQREKDELRQYAVRDVVESLLPTLENLGLAVASARQAADSQSIVTGVSMVLEQFRSTLSGVGLTEINPAQGTDFDPHQHESLAHAPSAEVEPEKILQVVRTGYSLKGRLLRPASVVLSSGPATSNETAESKP